MKYALRGLLRDRVFTLVALLSIALGVGANSAMFSLVDQALFRNLPVKEPERLVLMSWKGTFLGRGWGSSNLQSFPFYRDLAAENQVFDAVFCRHPTQVFLTVDNAPEQVSAEIVSGTYFPALGVGAALGRTIGESDDLRPGGHPVVVLSFDYWKTRMGGSPAALGRKVLVNNHPMTVIGVAAEGFRGVDFGEVPSLWVPVMMKREATPDFDWLVERRSRWLHVFGRLKPGVTIEAAQAGLAPWFHAMLEADTTRDAFPQVTEEQRRRFLASRLEVLPASQGRSDLRVNLRSPLLALQAATALVLLLACLNVANLCLARAFARRRELALRAALGASPGRLARELLTQSAILAFCGGALGMLLAPIVIRALSTFLPRETAAVVMSSAVNPRVLLFTLAAAVLTGLLFGFAPAMQASRAEPGWAIKERSSTHDGGVGLRKLLVTGQVALALILLIGAGLFVRSLAGLRARGPGFSTTNLMVFRIDTARMAYTKEQSRILIHNLMTALRNMPEVNNAAISAVELLMGGSWNERLTLESGRRVTTDSVIHCNAITPGFFATLGTSVVAGRDFDGHDEVSDPKVGFRSAIVNESFAKRYFGDRNPLGARIGTGISPDTKANIEIVGVVRDFAYRGLRAPDDQAFFPYFEGGLLQGGEVFLRTKVASPAAFSAIRAVVRNQDAALPVTGMRTLEDQLDRSLTNERLLANLATAFAALALLLTVVGLYGVMSFVVTRRTREIGIRIALGASPGAALWLVLRDAALMVAAGLVIALPVVWGTGRLIENQLFGVHPMDGATIAAAAALVTVVALAASAVPARRATAINPIDSLRSE